MLRCRDIEHHASEYLDQTLPPLLRLRIRMHLLICRNCRRYTQQLRLTVKTLSKLVPKRASAPDQLIKQMQRQASENRRR